MKRTSLFIDEQTTRQLQKIAKTRGISFAAVVREALAGYVAGPERRSTVPSIAGRFSSGFADTSERADELLWPDPHS